MIQSAINRVLSLSAVLAGRTPQAEAVKVEKSIERDRQIKAARQSLTKAQENVRRTRRRFIDYMRNEPTSFGLKLGQLPKDVQKTVLSEYTPSQRRKIMNEKDAMKKYGSK